MPRIGTNILVIIAGGKLSRIPMERPISHPEHGMSIKDNHKTNGESVKECPEQCCAFIREGHRQHGQHSERAKARPQRFANANRDIFSSLERLMPKTSQFLPTAQSWTGVG